MLDKSISEEVRMKAEEACYYLGVKCGYFSKITTLKAEKETIIIIGEK